MDLWNDCRSNRYYLHDYNRASMSKNSETHAVCNKHNIGGESVCCECSGKTDCSNAPTEKVATAKVEAIRDWIETCLDADAHGAWHRAPNFDIIQDVAELMAPRIVERLTQTIEECEAEKREMIEAIKDALPTKQREKCDEEDNCGLCNRGLQSKCHIQEISRVVNEIREDVLEAIAAKYITSEVSE